MSDDESRKLVAANAAAADLIRKAIALRDGPRPIYRVIRRGTYNPGGRRLERQGSPEVIYCGTDLDLARVAYHTHAPTDHRPQPGSYGVETRLQRIRARAREEMA